MTNNFEHIKLGNDKDALIRVFNDELTGSDLGSIDTDDVIDVITYETPLNTQHYLIARIDDKTYESYRLLETRYGNIQLTDASRGTAYVILQPIMMAVMRDDAAREQVTRIMAGAYSPLDILVTQKGATGDDLGPTIYNLNGWELRELHDFVDGMKVALQTMQSTTPTGAENIYPRHIDVPDEYDGDYDDVEAEALLEEEDAQLEAELDAEAEAFENAPDVNTETHTIPEHKQNKQEKSLATKLLGIFKRK